MRTVKIVVLALGLAAFATGCGKKKDTSTPATTTEPAADGASGSGTDTANPCGGGGDTAPNPCNPCGGAADPCGGGE